MNLENEVLQVNLDDIIPNRFQPRIAFDETGLKELADSIREHGIIQPLVLRKLGNKYEIIAGERRYKAATLAGLETVPAVISNIDDNKSAEVALVENIQRRDLTPIEEAKSYKTLLDKGYLTQEQLAKKMGISQPAVANKLRLLNLDEEVQQALLSEKISERHARALLQINDKDKQKEWLNRIINERLTVRQLDQEIKKMLEENDSEGNIPLVELNPSIEEIKANAEDIKPIELENKTNEIDTINQPLNFDSIINNNQSNILNPENKFFNFTNEILDMNIENDNKNSENTNNNIEIIDMPIIENKEPEKLIEDKIEPQEEVLSNIELNINNKFFTPFNDEPENLEDNIVSQEETIIDPMENVKYLEPSTDTIEINEEHIKEEKQSDFPNSITKIRELVNELKNEGINIDLEEIDLLDQYKINITIDKQ